MLMIVKDDLGKQRERDLSQINCINDVHHMLLLPDSLEVSDIMGVSAGKKNVFVLVNWKRGGTEGKWKMYVIEGNGIGIGHIDKIGYMYASEASCYLKAGQEIRGLDEVFLGCM